MREFAMLLTSMLPRSELHHPVLVLHPDHFQALVGVIPWGA